MISNPVRRLSAGARVHPVLPNCWKYSSRRRIGRTRILASHQCQTCALVNLKRRCPMSEVSPSQQMIFINYRHSDVGWAADNLATKLADTFGADRVFIDHRGIEAGEKFAKELEEALNRTAILVVLIGETWLTARLAQQDDWVREEIRVGLQRETCRVIPVLIDDAKLPAERTALPEDIRPLFDLQRRWVRRQTSDSDIEALTKDCEKAGLRRLLYSRESIDVQDFSDKKVAAVVMELRQLQLRQGELVHRRELLRALDRLFNRKTFRFETLRTCPEQRWGDRLDSAYQIEKVLRDWEGNLQEVADERYQTYRDLMGEVGSYCMQMGALLFEPAVDYNRIEDHIGKPTFKAQLPPAIRFPAGADKQPKIPDEINDPIERHRAGAVTLMNELAKE